MFLNFKEKKPFIRLFAKIGVVKEREVLLRKKKIYLRSILKPFLFSEVLTVLFSSKILFRKSNNRLIPMKPKINEKIVFNVLSRLLIFDLH